MHSAPNNDERFTMGKKNYEIYTGQLFCQNEQLNAAKKEKKTRIIENEKKKTKKLNRETERPGMLEIR